MVEVNGNVYQITKDKFLKTYTPIKHQFKITGEYSPCIISKFKGQHEIMPYISSCITNNDVNVYAKQLERNVKLYTLWDKENYMSGKIGDYLVIRTDDNKDIYIVEASQFQNIYESI